MSGRQETDLRRIHVVGTSGSGKTTLARRLAQVLDVPHVELDAIFWGPDWTETPTDLFRQRAARALEGEAWTTDGNYSKVRDIVWGRADTVVWLNFPLALILWRVTTRTLRRTLTREELWSGNRETLGKAFFHRDSIIFYALRTHRRRRCQYPELFKRPEYRHLRVVELHSPHQARRWLKEVQSSR
ncbi:MAG: adenylate kinase [Anaerolineae bacterium]